MICSKYKLRLFLHYINLVRHRLPPNRINKCEMAAILVSFAYPVARTTGAIIGHWGWWCITALSFEQQHLEICQTY